jgi:hypothetical protein
VVEGGKASCVNDSDKSRLMSVYNIQLCAGSNLDPKKVVPSTDNEHDI